MSSDTPLAAGFDPTRSRRRGLGVLVVALLPALAAIWGIPGFVTQDGPAHLYNAHIIEQTLDHNSLFPKYFQVHWRPLPNWAGHLALAGLLRVLPPDAADRVMTSLTLVLFAGSLVWLRKQVAGWSGMPWAALVAVLLALNVTWLLGFASFSLGACVFAVTLGVWWRNREQLGPKAIGTLALLVVLGYFSHLVSLGLTAAAIMVLACFVPTERRRAILIRTLIALGPLVPLGAAYLSLTREGGPMRPQWQYLSEFASPESWRKQLVWVDPISLASKLVIPFYEEPAKIFAIFSPALWFAVAMTVAVVATIRRRGGSSSPQNVWLVLAAIFVFGGIVTPDSLGPSHGNYLAQRVVLFGLMALVPFLDLELEGLTRRAFATALGLALTIQLAFVWDFALTSRETAGALQAVHGRVGEGQRVVVVLNQFRTRFRANPLLHASDLLGIRPDNIIWNDYETLYYYFPVQFRAEFRPGMERPDPSELERISLSDDPKDAQKRGDAWYDLLEKHRASIDTVVIWGADPRVDAVTRLWFERRYQRGQVAVWQRSKPDAR